MSNESTDSLSRSGLPDASRSTLAASTASSRPFLHRLNPMGRPNRGYQHLNETTVEEADEDDEDGHNSSARQTTWNDRAGQETLELRPTSKPTSPQPPVHLQTSGDTEPEDEDDVPQSFFLESAAPRKSSSRRSLKPSRRSRRPPTDITSSPGPSRISKPPRPSELDDPSIMSGDAEGVSTAYATTRPQRGLDDHQKALWNWVNVYNLDAYLQEVYAYYTGKGIYCIALSRGLNLLTIGFVIGFSTFLLGCVDYSRVHQDGTGQLSDLVIDHCVSRFSGFSLLLFICFTIFYIIQIIDFISGTRRLVDMYRFYTYLLGIPDADIQTIAWPEVVRRIGQIRDQNPGTAISPNAHALDASELHHSNSPPTATLDAHDIANRIMRQENYLIALFNKDLLDLQTPLPPIIEHLLGKYINRGNILTRTLEWNLRYCLLGHLFDRTGRVRRSILKEKQKDREIEVLRRRFIFMGVLNAIFAPFIVLYLLMYSFFRYFEEYHKNPSSIGGRQYTPYAEWKFREFNELPHIFKRRLNESYPVAGEYIDQFPKEKVALLMRFVAFVAGSFAAVLALATVVDPDIFLHFEITPHRTVLFYLGLFGSVLAVARGMVPDSHRVFDPEMLMREVISHTHYMPNEWNGELHSQKVQTDFGHLFEMRVVIFLQEIISVVVTPFVLWYSLPPCVPAIIDFFREFTVHVDGLGYVCSFAVFDFKRHGNVNFGVPTEVNDERFISNEGKMEKSFLNFKAANPDWNPIDPAGSAYLNRVAEYQQRELPPLGFTPSAARLRQQRSRTGRSGYGLYATPSPTFIHPNDTQFFTTQNQGPINEQRLAEKAATYERAFQKSASINLAKRRTTGGPQSGSLLHGREQDPKGKGRASPFEEDQPEPEPEELESELGDSYIHGVRTRGPREEDYLEEEDEMKDNGVIGLLAQIYTGRPAVG